MQIRDNVFIVTGGASGLGGVTSGWLADRGARVVIADLNRPIQGLSDSVKFITTDVSDSVSAKAAVDFACDQFGGLHGLINCA
ncbi:MAG: SDR family NAD(P)-dependent oxidoreductase, partial [Betaproteobacteria bacterium]